MKNIKSIAFGCCLCFVALGIPGKYAHAVLFGVDDISDQLLSINTTTGAATAVGALGFGRVLGLAFNSSGTLFGVDETTDQLLTINTITGAATAVGSVGFSNVQGLAFSSSGTLFGVDNATDNLLTINTTTGAGTVVGPHGFPVVSGLAFDSSGTLFGSDFSVDQLLTINTTTGAGTTVGPLGFGNLRGLAFDSGGTLFGVDVGNDNLLTINPTTGVGVAVGSLGFGAVEGLAFRTISAPIPEPGALALFGLAVFGMLARRCRISGSWRDALQRRTKQVISAAAMLVVAFLLPVASAGAAVITVFTDLASWQTAVGASNTIDFESTSGVITGSEFSASPGSPVFSNQTGRAMVVGTGNSQLLPTSGTNLFLPVASPGDPTGALDGDPIGEIRVTFDTPVFAMGAFFLDLALASALPSVGFDLTDDGIPDVTFASAPGTGSQAFLGFITDTPLSFVDMHIGASDPDRDGAGIDDLSYVLAEAVAVMEPGSLALFGLGLAGLAGLGCVRRFQCSK
jgi:hypothetical protein